MTKLLNSVADFSQNLNKLKLVLKMELSPRSPTRRLTRTSSYSRPGSAEFQKAFKSRTLSKKLSKMTTSRLDEKVQALLNEVTNRSDMQSFFLKGKMQCDQNIQTDHLEADFQDMTSIVKALRDVHECILLGSHPPFKQQKSLIGKFYRTSICSTLSVGYVSKK